MAFRAPVSNAFRALLLVVLGGQCYGNANAGAGITVQLDGRPDAERPPYGEHFPEYDRQLLGEGIRHPWLGVEEVTGSTVGGSPVLLVAPLAANMDSNKNGFVSFQELHRHMERVAKLRLLGRIKQSHDRYNDHIRAAFGAGDKDNDGLFNYDEVFNLDHSADSHVANGEKRLVQESFTFADINQDNLLNEDEFLLHSFRHYEERHAHSDHLTYTDKGAHALLALADENHDGRLSKQEMAAYFTHFVLQNNDRVVDSHSGGGVRHGRVAAATPTSPAGGEDGRRAEHREL